MAKPGHMHAHRVEAAQVAGIRGALALHSLHEGREARGLADHHETYKAIARVAPARGDEDLDEMPLPVVGTEEFLLRG